jgi:hypothetical protein
VKCIEILVHGSFCLLTARDVDNVASLRRSDVLMKALRSLVHSALAICAASTLAATADDHRLQLRGVVDVAGLRAALIELDHAVPGSTNEHRALTRLMLERDVLEPDPSKSPRLEHLAVDAAQMKISVKENGVEKAYAIPSGSLQWPGTNRLALANAPLTDTIDLLSLLTDRIVHFHPKNEIMSPEIQCHWTNSVTTKSEAAKVLENSFATQNTLPVLCGSSFLILAPRSLTNEITRRWVSPSSGPPEVAPFVACNMKGVMSKYSELTRQISVGEKSLPEAWCYVRTLKPMSKAEAIYLINTIFNWNGCRIIDGTDKTFKIEFPDAAHGSS